METTSRKIFLVPTGKKGCNDYTLERPVSLMKNEYIWGFVAGLSNRIYSNISPGDILLFSSQGTGMFNRIAMVKEKLCIDEDTSDKIWTPKDGHIRFPLVVTLTKPVEIQWDKELVLSYVGYQEYRLLAAIHIKSDHLNTFLGETVYRHSLQTLGLQA